MYFFILSLQLENKINEIMSLVIKNYFKDFSEEKLYSLSPEELREIHHKAWMKDGLESRKWLMLSRWN